MSLSVSLQEGLCLWVVASCGLVQDGPLDPMFASPSVGLAWLAFFVIILVVTIGSLSMGAQHCPALASSAIYTSTSMSMGYIAQTFIHHQHLKPVKLMGAGLMLLAVVLVAVARSLQSKEASARELEGPLLGSETDDESDALKCSTVKASQPANLANFIAEEFS